MADKKFEQYTEETTVTNDDLFLIKEKTSGATKRVQASNILPAGSVTTAKLADTSVTNAKLATSAGQPGAGWTSWTPTWTNLTIGNATVTAKYIQIGKVVHGFIKVILGSTSSVTGAATFSVPATAASQYNSGAFNVIGSGYAEDAGVAALNVTAALNASTTVISLMSMNTGGSYGNLLPISGTVPITWGTSDFFNITFMYEAA